MTNYRNKFSALTVVGCRQECGKFQSCCALRDVFAYKSRIWANPTPNATCSALLKAWFRIRRAMEIPWHDDKWCILTHYFFEGKCLYWFLDIRYNLRNNHLSPGAAYYMGIWLKIGLIWPICVGHTYVHLIITKVKGIKKSNNLSENRSFSFVLIVVQST